MKADVLVIGAGSAGLAAAVRAAREGARILLVERRGYAGGMGTAALVHTFCGLYLQDGDRPQWANPGTLAAEIGTLMQRATGRPPVKMGRLWVLPQDPTEFALLADRMLRKAGVEILFHTELCGLEPEWTAHVLCRGRRAEIEARAVIDTSGDAVAAVMLGAEFQMSAAHRLQRPAYICGVHGVKGPPQNLQLAGRVAAAIVDGTLPRAAEGVHFREGAGEGEIYATLDLSGDVAGTYDPVDAACLSGLEMVGREVLQAIVAHLRTTDPAWERAHVSHWPAQAGIRESRRWIGREILRGQELLSGRRRDGEVAVASWPLELRESARGPKWRHLEGPAGIPAGALEAAGHARLFTAGRCLSCDHDAQASVRVMGTCFATGDAAGKLAVRAAAEIGS